jgi:arsenite-transporting ATPase
VTIPEALGMNQARRVVAELSEFGLQVRHLVVNNVISQVDSDFLRRRQAMQQPYLELIDREYAPAMEVTRLPLFADEMKGIERLSQMERILFAR